jgi:3-methylfumaryl-CoA hydratase
MNDFSSWVGREQMTVDTICENRTRLMAATMDRQDLFDSPELTVLPAGWHWLFFNSGELQSRLGPDGHPACGGFLPPIPQPRRMWAGSRLDWHAPFRIGARIERHSQILRVEHKSGDSGDMVFVTARHAYRDGAELLLEEEQDIVYRGESSAAERAAFAAVGERAAAFDGKFQRSGDHCRGVRPDPVLLFRYSALTFNGHRIHYDLPYTRNVEHYPGLVVHGPLLATLLLDFVTQRVHPGRRLAHFSFRAKRPTFDISEFHLHASHVDDNGGAALWSTNNVGEVAVDGKVVFAGAGT